MEKNRKNRIKNPDIGYITIDSDGRICSCNDLAATLLGSTPLSAPRALAALVGAGNAGDAIVVWQIRLPRARRARGKTQGAARAGGEDR